MDTIKNYELITILSPKADAGASEEVKKQLTGFGWEITGEENMGTKKLAYQIRKLEKGNYWVWNLATKKPIDHKALNLTLNRNNNIIRYLLIKK
jgi:ribosomal protein S6